MVTPLIHSAFAAGELSPALYGRVDYQKYTIAATTLRNAQVNYRGGAYSRAGTAYVLRSRTTPGPNTYPPHLITFQFSITQGYALELGDHYMRFYANGIPLLEGLNSVIGATQANPCVVTTVNNHRYPPGVDVTFLIPIPFGMTQLNGLNIQVISVTNNTLSLNIDSSRFTPFAYPSPLPSAYTPPSVIPSNSGVYLPPLPLPYGNEKSFEGVIYNSGEV